MKSVPQNNIFFIGIAGAGMSAIAQFLAGKGKNISGSDRFFKPGEANETQAALEVEGITCLPQDESGLGSDIELVVVSTAIEDSVPEVQKAKALNIPIIKRSELLAKIAADHRTIAIAGTSGKSTTAAMLFEVMSHAGYNPGIITGAGLTRLIREGKIGNAAVGDQWLIIEADESDGSVVLYRSEIGVLLNIDKDHQEIDELNRLFDTFRSNSKYFITNRENELAAKLAVDPGFDFGSREHSVGFQFADFRQEAMKIFFTINGFAFELNSPGRHNMENAAAAVAAAEMAGVPIEVSAEALKQYEGIYRRHQVIGQLNGVTIIDDYAHNPAKCAASIRSCQFPNRKLLAWFQPHGYGPTKFLRKDFVEEISAALRDEDEIWMSEIYYAGGTAVKDISAKDLIDDLKSTGASAFFVGDRHALADEMRPHLSGNAVVLLMGARDPSLAGFATEFVQGLNCPD